MDRFDSAVTLNRHLCFQKGLVEEVIGYSDYNGTGDRNMQSTSTARIISITNYPPLEGFRFSYFGRGLL